MTASNIPRVVISTLGMDQHENGAIAVQRMLMESQMVVSYMGVLNTPAQVAEHAEEVDADVVGISCHSWEYLTLVPELLKVLSDRQQKCSVVIGGSVITPKDAEEMLAKGVDGVFDGRASQDQIVNSIRDLVIKKQNAESTD
jgi:methylmalonyl-CoA mutase cobalamin-binding domain/chain